MGQGTDSPPSIHIGSHKLNAVDRFQYLGSTISSNLSLEPEINSRIAKASAVMSKLHKRVWSNNNLTVNTKMRVYRACVLSTLLYSSETWTTYAAQEKRLNSFHLRFQGAYSAYDGRTRSQTRSCLSLPDCHPSSCS